MINKIRKFFEHISPLQTNTALIILTIALVKIPIVIRDLVLTTYFGVNKNLDLYFYVLIVPMFFFGIISLSFNWFFIPAYLKIKTQKGINQAKGYTSTLFTYTAITLTFIAFLISWVIPKIVVKINPVFFNSESLILYFYNLSTWAGIFFLFCTLSSFFTSLLQAEHRYLISLYPQILIPASGIFFIILFYKSLGVASAIYGTTIGSILCFTIYYLYSLNTNIISGFGKDIHALKTATDNRQLFVLVFALIIPSFMALIDQQMASFLGEGKLTTLTYGMRIPDGLSEILSVGLGIAVFSHFSQWHIDGRNALVIEATQKLILLVTFFLVPVCIFLIAYAYPIISVIFERGAFGREATWAVSRVLQWYAFVFYFSVIATIAVRIISSMGKNHFFIILGLIIFILKIVSNVVLIQKLGINGLPLATVIIQIINCYLLYRYLRENGICVFTKSFLNTLCGMLFAIIAISGMLLLARVLTYNLTNIVIIIIGTSVLGCLWVVFFMLNKKFRFIAHQAI